MGVSDCKALTGDSGRAGKVHTPHVWLAGWLQSEVSQTVPLLGHRGAVWLGEPAERAQMETGGDLPYTSVADHLS